TGVQTCALPIWVHLHVADNGALIHQDESRLPIGYVVVRACIDRARDEGSALPSSPCRFNGRADSVVELSTMRHDDRGVATDGAAIVVGDDRGCLRLHGDVDVAANRALVVD